MTHDNVFELRPGQDIVPRDVPPSPVVTPPAGLPVVEVSVFDEPIVPRWESVRRWLADKRWDAEYFAREKWIHAKRSPDYLLRALSFSHVGLARCVRWWWRWAWDLEALQLRRRLILDLDVKSDKAVALVRAERQARKWSIIRRMVLTGAFDAGLVAGGWWVHGRPTWQEAPAWVALAVAVVVFLGRVGSDKGQIVQPVTVVMPHTLTEESIRVAAAASGFGDVRIVPPGPRRDGLGTSWVMELPPGKKHYADVEKDAAAFAANLHSDGDLLDVKPVPGRGLAVNCWLAEVDPMTLPAPAWPLLEGRDLPWGSPWTLGWTLRSEPVDVHSVDAHILVGSQPRKGKTTALRAFALAHILDPRAELAVFNLGGTEDFAGFRPFSRVYRNDAGAVDACMAFLDGLEAERARRMQVLSGLGLSRLEAKAVGKVAPLLVIIDEVHRLTTHPTHGGENGPAVKRLRMLMQECAKAGIRFLFATQRPDSTVMPNQVRDLCGVRLALKVATWQNSQAILAGDSQSSGLDASTLSGRRGEAMVRIDADDADPVATRLRIAPATAEHLEPVLLQLAERRTVGQVAAAEAAGSGPSWRERVLGVWPAGQRNAFTRDLAAALGVSASDLKSGLAGEGVEQRASVSVAGAVSVGFRHADLVGGLVDG